MRCFWHRCFWHSAVTHQPIQCSKRPQRDCWVELFWTSVLQIVFKELGKEQTHPFSHSLLSTAQVEFVKAEFQTKEEYILRKCTELFHDISCTCVFQKLCLFWYYGQTLQSQIYLTVVMRNILSRDSDLLASSQDTIDDMYSSCRNVLISKADATKQGYVICGI